MYCQSVSGSQRYKLDKYTRIYKDIVGLTRPAVTRFRAPDMPSDGPGPGSVPS